MSKSQGEACWSKSPDRPVHCANRRWAGAATQAEPRPTAEQTAKIFPACICPGISPPWAGRQSFIRRWHLVPDWCQIWETPGKQHILLLKAFSVLPLGLKWTNYNHSSLRQYTRSSFNSKIIQQIHSGVLNNANSHCSCNKNTLF